MSDQVRPRPPLSTLDMAARTGMSAEFVRLEIEAGELHAIRFGRVWRIPAEEADRYLAAKQFPVDDAE